jgi:peptidase M50B-like protein
MAQARPAKRFDWWGFLLLCAIYLGLAFLWNTIWVYPLKLFVVLLHEASHGLAALATGGRIEEILVFPEEGGRTTTTGGNGFVITSAGYLGSMLLGATILLVSTRTRLSQWLALLIGMGVVTLAFRCMPADGRAFAVAFGVVLAGTAPMPRPVSEMVLRVIGVTSCLYAILDIKSDVLDREHDSSDASALAAMTGIPAVVWGALWIAISIVVTFYAAKWAVTGAKAPKYNPAHDDDRGRARK